MVATAAATAIVVLALFVFFVERVAESFVNFVEQIFVFNGEKRAFFLADFKNDNFFGVYAFHFLRRLEKRIGLVLMVYRADMIKLMNVAVVAGEFHNFVFAAIASFVFTSIFAVF